MNGAAERIRLAFCLLPLTACAVTPLTNRIAVGEDPFVIGVGEGSDGNTDLFAASASGGSFVRLTFTGAEERAPRLSPDGTMVGFFRRGQEGGLTRWTVVALDLTSSAERTATLPEGAGEPERLGWTPDGASVVLRAGGYFEMAARSGTALLRQIPGDSLAQADSAVGELLGTPALGMVVECADGNVCIAAGTGEVTALGEGITGAVRWGTDSVGYFAAGGFEVRPLGGGRSRRPTWSAAPQGLRSITYHPGRQTTLSSGESGTR